MFNLNGNWVDLVIILIILYYGMESLRYSLWAILADFLAFFGSLLISLKLYGFVAKFLGSNFNLPNSMSNALGFIFTAIAFEIGLSIAFAYLVTRLPKKIKKNKYNKIISVLPALGQGILIVAFLLSATMSVPIKPQIKTDISNSKIGSRILSATTGIEQSFKDVFGGAIDDALTHMTIKPGSRDSVKLETKAVNLTVDETSESQMFAMVNAERKKRGIAELTWEPKIVPVSRAHARDMWERNYFSHYSPEGKDVGDRLDKSGVRYGVAGENLALAPTLQSAHTGLMNSEGHRENILNPEFKKIGIGVIDNGYYGKMFVQVFTD